MVENLLDIPPTQLLAETTERFIARLREHPFLTRCRNGTITMPELKAFLAQHGKYSSYFTRYLCALISNLDSSDDVLRLAENLSEELGYGESHQIPHSRLYADMLANFDVNLAETQTTPQTEALIQTMFSLCRQPESLSALAALCLGAEAIVPAMYSDLIKGFIACGVDSSCLKFFYLHVECDDDHAQTMVDILNRKIADDPSGRITVLNAAEAAIRARLRFFDGLQEVCHA